MRGTRIVIAAVAVLLLAFAAWRFFVFAPGRPSGFPSATDRTPCRTLQQLLQKLFQKLFLQIFLIYFQGGCLFCDARS